MARGELASCLRLHGACAGWAPQARALNPSENTMLLAPHSNNLNLKNCCDRQMMAKEWRRVLTLCLSRAAGRAAQKPLIEALSMAVAASYHEPPFFKHAIIDAVLPCKHLVGLAHPAQMKQPSTRWPPEASWLICEKSTLLQDLQTCLETAPSAAQKLSKP